MQVSLLSRSSYRCTPVHAAGEADAPDSSASKWRGKVRSLPMAELLLHSWNGLIAHLQQFWRLGAATLPFQAQ